MLLLAISLALLAVLSMRYPLRLDWTAQGRHTLSPASQLLLQRLEHPVHITAYISDHSLLRDAIIRLVARYQRHSPTLILQFVNPDLFPTEVRKLDIRQDGELYVEYAGRGEKVRQISEQALTQALQRLSRPAERLVVFLDRHGERKVHGIANHDWGQFGQELAKIGLVLRPLAVNAETPIPKETAALVIASPQMLLPPATMQAVLNYVRQGGNLLWTLEPNDQLRYSELAALFGITVLPGMILDQQTSRLNIHNPSFIPIVDYAPHPITMELRAPTLFPQAAALQVQESTQWQAIPLLEAAASSVNAGSSLEVGAQLETERQESAAPMVIGMALSRDKPPERGNGEQRVVVLGDSDFLANTYLDNGANLELGLNIVSWLVWDEALITIPPRQINDPRLQLSPGALARLAALFLLILPSIFIISAWWIWRQRRRL